MIQSLTVDVAALQQLPETEPLGLSLVEGGLCGGTCLLASNCALLSCLLFGSCGTTTGSPPE